MSTPSFSSPAAPAAAPLSDYSLSGLSPRALKRRLDHWFEARLPLADSVTLTQRSVYILPTRPGLMLAVTLLVLLVASINYQLNLGYLLTFLLAGCALVGMHVSHATLRGLTLNLIAPRAVFSGATAAFDIKISNPDKSVRYSIGIRALLERGAENPPPTHQWAWCDVPAQGTSSVQVAFHPVQRGRQRLPALTAETRFPLGTFRVWTIWRPAAHVLVYPAPEAHPPPLPPARALKQGALQPLTSSAATRLQDSSELDGIRNYRRGDSLKHILWKKAALAMANPAPEGAGNAGFLVRAHEKTPPQRSELWLDIDQAGSHGLEAQLSRLCAWVLQAEAQGLRYGLRLRNQTIAPGSGTAHHGQCLEALALC